LVRQGYKGDRREELQEGIVTNATPIDDSAVVDDIFGFLGEQKDTVSEAQAPSAFRDLPAPAVFINQSVFFSIL